MAGKPREEGEPDGRAGHLEEHACAKLPLGQRRAGANFMPRKPRAPRVDPLRRRALEHAALALIVAAVAVLTFHPHYNALTGARDPFPVHADEYVHWGNAAAIMEHGTLDPPDPFAPVVQSEAKTTIESHERSFQAYLGVLQASTGIPWTTMLTLGPTFLAILAVLALYVVGETFGAGLSTALWFLAVPTSLRFLGPGFMVPIAFVLPLIALALYLLLAHRGGGALAALLILTSALWTIHTAGALVVTIAASAYAFVTARWSPLGAATLIAAIALPLLFAHGRLEILANNAQYKPILPLGAESLRLPGVLLYLSAALGVFTLTASADPRRRGAGSVIAVVLLVLLGIIAYRANTGIDPYRAYDRSTLMAAFVATIAAGVGVSSLARWVRESAPRTNWRVVGTAAVAAIVLLQVASVASAARSQLEQPYYVSMTSAQFDAYEQAARALDERHRLALVQGPTMPFSIVTGIPTVHVRAPEDLAEPQWVQRFFREGAKDTRLLVESGVTVVVTTGAVTNPDLREVAPGVYALRGDYVDRMTGR